MNGALSFGGDDPWGIIGRGVPVIDTKPSVRLEAGRALYVLGQGTRAVPTLARLVRGLPRWALIDTPPMTRVPQKTESRHRS